MSKARGGLGHDMFDTVARDHTLTNQYEMEMA